MATSLRGIERFSRKISAYRNLLMAGILEEFLKEGQNYAYSLYAQSTNPSNPEPYDDKVTVTYDILNDVGVLRANSNIIAYLEYGYGLEGDGTYEGNLPTEPITFETRYQGEWQTITVNGWTYYYDMQFVDDNGETAYNDFKQPKDGTWKHDGKVYHGEPAEAQMWRTAIYLRENAENIINRVLQRAKVGKV